MIPGSFARAFTKIEKRESSSLHQGTPYSLSWGPDEKPTQAKMVTAARASLRALGLEQHQAVLVAHRDGTTPHVHVVANRVSIEDGRAAPLSQSRLDRAGPAARPAGG